MPVAREQLSATILDHRECAEPVVFQLEKSSHGHRTESPAAGAALAGMKVAWKELRIAGFRSEDSGSVPRRLQLGLTSTRLVGAYLGLSDSVAMSQPLH